MSIGLAQGCKEGAFGLVVFRVLWLKCPRTRRHFMGSISFLMFVIGVQALIYSRIVSAFPLESFETG